MNIIYIMNIKRFPQTRKVRLIINDVHIITRVSHVRAGLGDKYEINAATQKALDALEFTNASRKCFSISGVWEGINVQLNLM